MLQKDGMKLTADEINALEPGERTDALVAEYVMGKPMPTNQHNPDHIHTIDFGSWHCTPLYDEGDVCRFTPHAFSSQIGYAWMALAQFDEYEVRSVSKRDGYRYYCELSRLKRDGDWAFGDAFADTAEMSICKASLMAVMNA